MTCLALSKRTEIYGLRRPDNCASGPRPGTPVTSDYVVATGFPAPTNQTLSIDGAAQAPPPHLLHDENIKPNYGGPGSSLRARSGARGRPTKYSVIACAA